MSQYAELQMDEYAYLIENKKRVISPTFKVNVPKLMGIIPKNTPTDTTELIKDLQVNASGCKVNISNKVIDKNYLELEVRPENHPPFVESNFDEAEYFYKDQRFKVKYPIYNMYDGVIVNIY